MNKIKLGMSRRIRSLRRIEKYVVGKRMLDVGCHTGITTNYFSNKGLFVLGIDINEKYIDFAKSNYHKGKFLLKDIMGEKGKYDTILLIGVLEETPFSPEMVLNKLKNNLNKNGRIIIEVRNIHSVKRRIKTLFGLEPVDPFDWRLWCFTKKRLEKVISDTGYKILKITSNKWESLRSKTFPTPDSLSEEIWAVIELKKH